MPSLGEAKGRHVRRYLTMPRRRYAGDGTSLSAAKGVFSWPHAHHSVLGVPPNMVNLF